MKALMAALASLPLVAAPALGLGQARVDDHQYRSEDIQAGSRLYDAQCALCHLPTGDGIDGTDLRRGSFRSPMSDAELRSAIETGNPDAGMPAFPLEAAELDQLIAFIRAGFDPNGSVASVGDARRGRSLFEGKGECSTCHRVGAVGPHIGPDLSDIGATRTPAGLHQKLLDPSSALIPIQRPVRVTTRDGRTVRGRRLNEDTYTVQMIDSSERLVSFVKAELTAYEVSLDSAMPKPPLDDDERADVVAYLLSLRVTP